MPQLQMLLGRRHLDRQGLSPQSSFGKQFCQPEILRVLASTLKAKTLFSSSTYPDAILERSQEGIRKLNPHKTKSFFLFVTKYYIKETI